MTTNKESIDFSLNINRGMWLQHPVVGSPSWDTFVRESITPIYIGKPPYEWPVNGFLFHDPVSLKWYAYIGLYPRNYFPSGGCLLLKETTPGTWTEIGIVLSGDPNSFDGDGQNPGGMPDVSVVYADKRYHLVYDWGNHQNTRGGIAYAWADSPEGPFHRAHKPIHLDADQPLVFGRYNRVYAATLFKRSSDWLILAMMSTPRNAGGTWALVCFTGKNPEGPYSGPQFLLYPQSNSFHPPLAEFYPAFEYEEHLYVPATSVAKNRTFQIMYTVSKWRAHIPEAWQIFQYGSIWHDLPLHSYEQGIWGQTFSGQVSGKPQESAELRALSFSKTIKNIGIALISKRFWSKAYQDGFQLAAPYATARAILCRDFKCFNFLCKINTTGSWAFSWGCTGPIGADRNGADSVAHNLMMRDHYECFFESQTITIQSYNSKGIKKIIAQSSINSKCFGDLSVQFRQLADLFQLQIDETEIFSIPVSPKLGRIEFRVEIGTILKVNSMIGIDEGLYSNLFFLGTDAVAGAGCSAKEWKPLRHHLFHFGKGYLSQKNNSRAKWNVIGSKFHLYSPRYPNLGTARLLVDGNLIETIDFSSPKKTASACICKFQAKLGYHAVILETLTGIIPLDCLCVESENNSVCWEPFFIGPKF